MKSNKMIKILGFAATLIGAAATVLSNWVDDKKMDEKIEEKVNEALAKQNDEEES